MLKKAILASALLAGPAMAGVNSWTGGGPEGGIAWSVRYVSSQPGTALAVSGHSIYRTTNDGASWTVAQELGVADGVQLFVAPANPNRVYAVGNNQSPLRSDDGGATFTRVSRFGSSEENFECSFGLAASGDVAYGGTTAGKIYTSTDRGMTWTERSNGLPNSRAVVGQIAVDASDAARAYAIVAGDIGATNLYVTSDMGLNWTTIPSVCDGSCGSIAIDPADPRRILVAEIGVGLHLSIDGGTTWSSPHAGNFALVAFDPTVGNQAFAVSSTQPSAVFRSTNAGQSWSQVGSLPGNGGVTSLSVNPATGRLLVTSYEGVTSSDDAGASWSRRSSGVLAADLVQLLALADGSNRVLTLGYPGPAGVHQRAANGGSWSPVAIDQPLFPAVVTIDHDPTNPSVLYGGGNGFFRSGDAGATWTPVAALGQSVADLAVDPVNPQTIYAVSSEVNVAGLQAVYKSLDGGISWNTLGGGIPGTAKRSLTIDRTNTQNIYSIERLDHAQPILRSTDGGVTWAPASTGIPSTTVTHLQIDPRNGAIAYASTLVGLYRTENSGQSWSRLPGTVSFVHDVAIDPVITTNIIRTSYDGGSNIGIARSVDSGQTWEFVRRAEPGLLRLLALDPARPTNVIAAVDGFGAAEFEFATDMELGTTAASANFDPTRSVVLNLRNRGPAAASGLRLEITVPASATNTSASAQPGSCSRASATVLTCQVGALRNGENATITVSNLSQLDNGAQVIGRATSHERDVEGTNNTLTLTASVTTSPPPSNNGGGGGGGGWMSFGSLAALLALRALRARTSRAGVRRSALPRRSRCAAR